MRKEIEADEIRGIFFDKCLDKSCGAEAVMLVVNEYLGCQVSWCKNSHVCVFDPEKDLEGPKIVHTFGDGIISTNFENGGGGEHER